MALVTAKTSLYLGDDHVDGMLGSHSTSESKLLWWESVLDRRFDPVDDPLEEEFLQGERERERERETGGNNNNNSILTLDE